MVNSAVLLQSQPEFAGYKLTKGTGAYKGHKLIGAFTGTFTEGIYTFNYTGKYK